MEAKGSGRRLKVRNVAWQMMSLTTILSEDLLDNTRQDRALQDVIKKFMPKIVMECKGLNTIRTEQKFLKSKMKLKSCCNLVWMFWLMERGSRKAVRLHMLWVYYDEDQEMVDCRVQHTHLVLPLVAEAKACLAAFQWAEERQLQCVFSDCQVLINTLKGAGLPKWSSASVIQDIRN
ncbi:unnamed protein product [Camellia sinensis]